MGKYEKLLLQILRGSSDANIAFDDLCQLLRRLGFKENIRGSHHNFRKQGVEQKVNLQKDGSKAKAYQVRQIRSVIVENRLGGDVGDDE
jgi:predicted RNA binding protein YcfA (HicA-like mRNA interferase family)